MQEKIIEIIVYILNEMRNTKQINEIDLSKLNNDGYTNAEINTAFAWIFSKMETGEKIFDDRNNTTRSHRFFHQAEKDVLDIEAKGYLIQLKELGILSDYDIEALINKLILSGYYKAGINEINLILSTMLFDLGDITNSMNSLVLLNNETIH